MKYRVVKAMRRARGGRVAQHVPQILPGKNSTGANPDLQPLDEIDHWILLRRHIAELDLEHFRGWLTPANL